MMTYIIPYYPINENTDEKAIVITLFVLLLLYFIIYLSGYLYEGIRNKNWSIIGDFGDNIAKCYGGFSFIITLIFGILLFTISKLYEIL